VGQVKRVVFIAYKIHGLLSRVEAKEL
jgi:hypothetical protein